MSAGGGRGAGAGASGAPMSERIDRRPGRFARAYGAQPWHLLVLLACFALAAYAVSRILDSPSLFSIALWFVGAAVVWDLLVGPAYALADRLLLPLRRVAPRGVSPLNHVRVPALLASLLLLMWAPLVLQRSEGVYRSKTGLTEDPYLDRWLAVTAVLFLVSGLLWGLRVLRAGRSAHRG